MDSRYDFHWMEQDETALQCRNSSVSTTDAMRRDWDERARKNAFHYIASWRKEWDLAAFLASGEEDYQRLVAPVLARCGITASGEVMVELGCGAGRMTPNFARRYCRVLALDLSAEMLQRARQIHAQQKNILWLRVSGADLGCLASDSADFIFSYLVLQHLPGEELAFSYVREMLRVLRPGGAFLFQFNGSHQPTMNLRGRLAWSVVDALWSAQMLTLSRATASFLGLDPAAAGKSWRGVAIEASRIVAAVKSSEGELREISGESTPMAWCCGRKKTGA
jgi:ubiquinone/menaquinone biosynthesis C-methylase UbiE